MGASERNHEMRHPSFLELHTRMRDSMMGPIIGEKLCVERYFETAHSFSGYLEVLLGKTAMSLRIKGPVAYSVRALLQKAFASHLSRLIETRHTLCVF